MGSVTDMAMTKVKTTALLVGKERFDVKTITVKVRRLLQKVQIRDKNQRLIPTRLPDNAHRNGAVLRTRKTNLGQFYLVSLL